ncbi:MAG: hypothetical protein ACM3XN_09630 [Chloroflexota bacterium]
MSDETKYSTEQGRELNEIADTLPKILDTVTEKIPALIRGVIQTLFSEQAGRDLGMSVSAFYKALKESGMPDEIVNKMMLEYMAAQTKLIGSATSFANAKQWESEQHKHE